MLYDQQTMRCMLLFLFSTAAGIAQTFGASSFAVANIATTPVVDAHSNSPRRVTPLTG
jgi:hypothetical protein